MGSPFFVQRKGTMIKTESVLNVINLKILITTFIGVPVNGVANVKNVLFVEMSTINDEPRLGNLGSSMMETDALI